MKKTSWLWRFGILLSVVAIFYALWQMNQHSYSFLAAGHKPIRTTSNVVRGAQYTLEVYSWREDFAAVTARVKKQMPATSLKKTKDGEMVWQIDGTIIFVARGRQFGPDETPKQSADDKNWVILSIAQEHEASLFYRIREKLTQ